MTSASKHIDYDEIVARSPVGIAQLDVTGRHVLVNDRYCEIFGRTRTDVLGRELHDFILTADLDGARSTKKNSPIYESIRHGTPTHVTEESFLRQDGTSFPAACWIRPVVVDGKVRGSICTIIPLTEKRGDEQQGLHHRELSHRVKNMFAIAQAIVGQTLRSISAPREVVHTINQRLAALSNANTVLMRAQSGNASIIDVAEAAIAAHRSGAGRIQISGPDIVLGSKAALAITLALHELCTNATKYGALSVDAGTVLIEWTVVDGATEKSFRMYWKEQDGPPVSPPIHKGFGSRLIVDNVGSDLRGRGELIFDSRGVRWTLEAPFAALTE
ncbi:MAG: PAS domain S-box protein [Rhodospirillaceae bacterium]|nr:MAG: PAS domain S-box protein [Rhodospirillaceae bacterium]